MEARAGEEEEGPFRKRTGEKVEKRCRNLLDKIRGSKLQA